MHQGPMVTHGMHLLLRHTLDSNSQSYFNLSRTDLVRDCSNRHQAASAETIDGLYWNGFREASCE